MVLSERPVGRVAPAATSGRGSILVGGLSPRKAGALAEGFAAEGIVPTLAFEADGIHDLVVQQSFDLVAVPAALLQRDNGYDLAGDLQRAAVAVLVLDGRDERVPALGTTFHYVVPVSARVREVVLAGEVLLERAEARAARQPAKLRWGPIELDVSRREARCRSEIVALTKLQFRLLEALVTAGGAVVTRDELERIVYQEPSVDDGERISAHIRRIRRKLEVDSTDPQLLLTVRGEGFRLAG